MVDFVFVVIVLFCYLLRLRCYKWKSKSAFFEGGGLLIGEYFGWKGTIPSNPRWNGKTRDISISYGVEILADDYFVLSQYTHQTDGRTDRIATQYRALHYM